VQAHGRVPAMGEAAWCHVTMPATVMAAGPAGADGGNGAATCRKWHWRHPPAGAGPGGTCHVSPGQACRHRELVFFDKKFQRWSFLALRWRRWSYVSKIRMVDNRVCGGA
jgi:hypothetical protein